MNSLTYPSSSSLWQHLEFKSTLTTALVVSVLTTLISYQLTALLTDLILGCKPQCTARVRTFHALLLSRRSSPLAILNALLRRDALTRLYFRRQLASKAATPPHGEAILRDEASVKTVAFGVLALLLVTPPVVNMFSVGMTVESERVVSFREARFGGLGLRVVENRSKWRTEPMTEECEKLAVQGFAYDEVTARVLMCMQTLGPGENGEVKGKAGIRLLVENEVKIMVVVSMGTRFWERYYTGFIRTREGENLLLKGEAGRKEGGNMVKRGMKKILEVCRSELTVEETVEYSEEKNIGKWKEFVVGRKEVACGVELEKEQEGMMAVFKEVDRFVTVVRKKQMMVKAATDEQNEGFINAADKEFLRRRTRIAGMGMLIIMAGVVVVTRVVVGLTVVNDVNDGIERMVKERIGLEHCASALSERVGKTVLYYNTQRFDWAIDDN